MNTSNIDLTGKMENNVIESAFKFMRLSDVRSLNLTATNFGGPHIITLVNYLNDNPNLISLTLDENPIYTNEIIKVAKTLEENKTLKHLSLKIIPGIDE
jgi:hypothetical protein